MHIDITTSEDICVLCVFCMSVYTECKNETEKEQLRTIQEVRRYREGKKKTDG